MKFTTYVRDVNGNPVLGARVSVNYPQQGPGKQVNEVIAHLAAGETLDAKLAIDRLRFTIGADLFSDEAFTASVVNGQWSTDNPACAVAVAGDGIVFTLAIGSVRFAPTLFLPPPHKIKDNPKAIYVDRVGGNEWIYRDAWIIDESIVRLDEPVFGNPNGFEWERLKHREQLVKLKDSGVFVFLEYGFPTSTQAGPRSLVLVWVPRQPLGSTPNVVVFFPPVTAPPDYPPDKYPFLQDYPYAFLPNKPPEPLQSNETRQPYPGVGINYLDTGYKIVDQLLAAGRNPIVMMPIQVGANYAPFNTPSGLGRATAEVVRFLYARQLTSSVATPISRLVLSSGPTETFPPSGHFTTESIPSGLHITVSGFSYGINPVVNLSLNAALDEKLYRPEIFASSAAAFLANWRELWDIDGVDSGGWSHLSKAFAAWRNNSGRRLRSYHTQTTFHGTTNGMVDAGQIKRQTGSAGFVEEGTSPDGRTTWIYFSNSYLSGDISDPRHRETHPTFGRLDAHHMIPAIAFGHAAQFTVP